MKFTILTAAALLTALPAFADVVVTFRESAPKDRFTLTNNSSCALGPVDLTIDLSGSSAGLIFDVSADGAGFEVFQPFELVAGQERVTEPAIVLDGDTALELKLRDVPPGEAMAFTIDVDNTIGAREITVSGAEISGAIVRIGSAAGTYQGVFSDSATASVSVGACAS